VPTYTHNTYLELMIGGGFPALVLFLLLLGTVGVRAVRRMAYGSRIGGPFALAYVVGVAALGWTMDLYTNVMTMVMIAFLYRLAAGHGGATVLEGKASAREADGVATPGIAGAPVALPRG
jgi:O-antigen ligase